MKARMMMAAALLATSGAMIATPVFADEPQSWQARLAEVRARIDHVDTATLKKRVDAGEDFLLVDVRMPHEIEQGGRIDAPQHVEIPRGWLEVQISQHALDTETPIVVYCGAGTRSAFAVDTLREMGYSNVQNYGEGYFSWKQQGFPTTK